MTKLLILTNELTGERFEDYFDEVDVKSLADAIITVNGKSQILVEGEEIEKWDAVYLDPEPKAFNYSRVFLEALDMKDIRTNIDSSSIFILNKKPYLFHVLSEKGLKIPETVTISTEKGMAEMEKDVDFPVVAKKYEKVKPTEKGIFEEFEELKSFAELTEHGENFLVIQEFKEDDCYEVLYIDGDLITLKLEGNPWDSESEISRNYHNLSDEHKETVQGIADALGGKIFYTRLNNGHIMDVDNDPRLEMFEEQSGKSVYSKVASKLSEGIEE